MNSLEIVGDPLDERRNAIWSVVQELYGGTSYRLDDEGEFNQVLVVDERLATDMAYVVKLPRKDTCWWRHALWQEAAFTAEASDAADSAPVEVQHVLDIGYGDPERCPALANRSDFVAERHFLEASFVVYGYVPGESLSLEYVRSHFSPDEKLEFGRDLGKIICWFASAINPQSYDDICKYQRPLHDVWHPRTVLQQIARDTVQLNQMDREVRDIIIDFSDMARFGKFLSPAKFAPFIGHNDLQLSNLRFLHDGQWKTSGVFDNNMAGPSNLPLELRRFAHIGAEVVSGAIDSYYGLSGERCDPIKVQDAVNDWALAQTAINHYWRQKAGNPLGDIKARWRALGERWITNDSVRKYPIDALHNE